MSNIVPFQEMQGMAEAIAKSGLFGMKDTNSVLALMAVAQAEGLHPATAARDFHIIQGRPALKADAMLARFQQAGGKVEWTNYTDQEVTGVFSHPNGGSLSVTWTISQAQSIGLVKPGSGWQKFPRAMLRSRCISEGIRSVYPGSVTGFYSPEEVQDFEPKERNMGKIEPAYAPLPEKIAPVEITLSDMPDDVLDGEYKLLLPDGAVYSTHHTTEEWCVAYVNLTSKIFNSEKLSAGDKQHKITALRQANEKTRSSLSQTDQLALTQMVAVGKGAISVHGLNKLNVGE